MGRMKGSQIIGSAGNLNFYVYRGEVVARAKPGPKGSKRTIRRKRTEKQWDQIRRFGLASKFGHRYKELFNLTFETSERQLGFNQAIGHMMNTAILGTHPNYYIDFTRLFVARGKALPAEEVSVTSHEPGKIEFTWKDNSVDFPNAAYDEAILVAMYDAEWQCCYNLRGGKRTACRGILEWRGIKGKDIHCWISFLKKDGMAADSVYAGKVVVG